MTIVVVSYTENVCWGCRENVSRGLELHDSIKKQYVFYSAVEKRFPFIKEVF